MTGTRSLFWAAVLSVVFVTSTLSSAPPQPTTAAADQAGSAKPRTRLPNHYGKLSITAEQREQIYALQADYDGRIDDLQAQLERLRTQRNDALEGVLNAGQRAKLQEIRQERVAKRNSTASGAKE